MKKVFLSYRFTGETTESLTELVNTCGEVLSK